MSPNDPPLSQSPPPGQTKGVTATQAAANLADAFNNNLPRANSTTDGYLAAADFAAFAAGTGSGGGLGNGGMGPVFNVLAYGAKGDGTTDDAAAIRSAITAASPNGVVYFPTTANGYALGSALILPSNVILLGDNRKASGLSKLKPVAGYSGLLIQSANYGTTIIQQAAIVGITIDGSNTTQTAIQLQCQECTIEHVCILRCWTSGIEIGGISGTQLALNNTIQSCYLQKDANLSDPSPARFWNCILEDYYSADNKFYANYLEGCNEAGIHTRGSNTFIQGNHIYDTVFGIYSEDTNERIFTNNYIEFCKAASIHVENGTSFKPGLQAVICNNIFRNPNTDAYAPGASFNGGQCTTGDGVIELHGTNLTDAVISGNIVDRDSGLTDTMPYFVYVAAGASNIAISNNMAETGVVTTGESNYPPAGTYAFTNQASPFTINPGLGRLPSSVTTFTLSGGTYTAVSTPPYTVDSNFILHFDTAGQVFTGSIIVS